ncbi:5-formyltetrahydrofolate cyclo-ligase [Thalassotalea eurytherma]|uniref:5-formyltetrahydrofolate cyclo-ligase n=1 Tax=Thalassotalea eurytherma TaxID=1144278 RepID=A0ABQ6H372_9GAMM|nr:5-formyltetrahydrofolate cyclo-ligase [Thalassotalea eurytherma]GLX81316.1 5-formyltetrahydrofolate cyclo-ligase [Thalassotalea eurytherma]
METSDKLVQRKQLRQLIRGRRQALSALTQASAQESLKNQFIKLFASDKPESIAIYLANDGELDTLKLINHCWQQNIDVYLPVIHPFSRHHLLFQQYTPTTKMVLNRFGISEPKLNSQSTICPQNLSVLCTPLVAFDSQGNRMGMGGGFYDRTLSQLQQSKTKVIGLAHDCQQVDSVPVEPWDMPLSMIMTPTKIINC